MTTQRDEIIIEVSVDGRDWREWPLRWKPPHQNPAQIAPHMPRLDWQMWFAALGAPSPWFNNLIYRLLQNKKAVTDLLGPSPIGPHAPRFIRASLWSTRFTTPSERKQSGSAWNRVRKGLYFPVVSLTSN
jgi:hypothetical protein